MLFYLRGMKEQLIEFLSQIKHAESSNAKHLRIIWHATSKEQTFEILKECNLQPAKTIHIWEDQWMKKQSIILSRLRSMLGLNTKIHARATEIKRIDKKAADQFLESYHLNGTTSAYYKFGMFYQDELLAVATFSKPRTMNDGIVPYRSYEWERFATKNGYTIVGGLSKLCTFLVNELHPAHIMTYIDTDWGEGKGFIQLGFKEIKKMEPQCYLIKFGEWIRYPITRETEVTRQKKIESGYIEVRNNPGAKLVFELRNNQAS